MNRVNHIAIVSILALLPITGCKTTKSASEESEKLKPDRKTADFTFASDLTLKDLGKKAKEYKGPASGIITGKDWPTLDRQAREKLRRSPNDKFALVQLIAALAAQGRHNLAQVYAELAHSKYGEDADFLNMVGVAIGAADETALSPSSASLSYFQQAFKKKRDHAAAITNIGNLHLNRGRNKEALKLYQLAELKCKKCPAAMFAKARALTRAGDYQGAIDAIEAIVDDHSEDWSLQYLAGIVCMYGTKDKAEAKSYLEDALELTPKHDRKHKNTIKKILSQIRKGK